MIRDERTKALINTDIDALYKYKQERDKNLKMDSIEKDIDYLKNKIDQLYKLLEDRIEKNNGKVINN
jgi:flagellar motility protein MotE (MotC chaperone)